EIDTTANFNSPALRTDTSSETTVDPGGEFYFNKWYYWRFKGVNSYDTSNWSDTWTFQSTTNVYQFQPANKSVNISNKPLLDFGGISGATGYQYFLSTDSSFKNDKPVNVIGQANTRFIVNVMYGATYYWKVRAYHAKDTSTWSATWTFTTKNAPVIASPNLTSPKNNAINVPPGKVTFTWNANGVTAGIFDFQLAYTNDFSTTVVSGENLPNTSAAINGIKENLEYFWRVRTHKDTLVSQWSTVYKFTTAQSVGFADEVAAQNDFKIYPNPATQILYIASPENALVQQIILQQMNGKILYSENNNQTNFTSINIEKLKPGIYIIGIRTNNGLIYKRFVKQ
ncbi:MAG: T9SS type A sorting domain-containing protein, partial [Sphingobacteriales bacterium]